MRAFDLKFIGLGNSGNNSADEDDNPDILDFVGRAELRITRLWRGQRFGGRLRHSLRGGDRSHGSLQLDWSLPISGSLNAYAQLFSGYGESLIDYNFRQTRLGVGVSIVEWRIGP